jgi:hypothetical protein
MKYLDEFTETKLSSSGWLALARRLVYQSGDKVRGFLLEKYRGFIWILVHGMRMIPVIENLQKKFMNINID